MKTIIRCLQITLIGFLLSVGVNVSGFAQTGRIFYDINDNQTQEGDEPGFANLSVKVFQKGKELKVENCLAVVRSNARGEFVLPNTLTGDLRLIITESSDYCSDKAPKSMTFCLIADLNVSTATVAILIPHNPAHRRAVTN